MRSKTFQMILDLGVGLGLTLGLLVAPSPLLAQDTDKWPLFSPDGGVTESSIGLLNTAQDRLNEKRYEDAKTLAQIVQEFFPTYWRAWYMKARAQDANGQLFASLPAYDKAVSLLDDCAAGTVQTCGPDFPNKNHEHFSILFHAGMANLHAGHYDRASALLFRADLYMDNTAALDWAAAAEAAHTDVATAWNRYRKQVRGEPFAKFNDHKIAAKKLVRAKKPPFGFYAMVRQAFVDLRNSAYSKRRFYLEYAHAQQVARTEALATMNARTVQLPRPYENLNSRDYLIARYLGLRASVPTNHFPKNANLRPLPSYKISPALSPYAVRAAQAAEAAVDRKKFVEAENLYRLALATDPWWLEGQYNLAQLEFINYGWCGPDHTIAWMRELVGKGIQEIDRVIVPSRFYQSIDQMQQRLDDIFREAGDSDSFDLRDWCNIDANVSVIKPDRRIGN